MDKKDNDFPGRSAQSNLLICTEETQFKPTPPNPLYSNVIFLYLQAWFLALDSSDNNIGSILRNDLVIMQHLELCCFVSSHNPLKSRYRTNLQWHPYPYG